MRFSLKHILAVVTVTCLLAVMVSPWLRWHYSPEETIRRSGGAFTMKPVARTIHEGGWVRHSCYPNDDQLATIVSAIGRLERPHGLSTGCSLTPENIDILARASNIRSLALGAPSFSFSGIEKVAAMEELTEMILIAARVWDNADVIPLNVIQSNLFSDSIYGSHTHNTSSAHDDNFGWV